MRIGLFLRNLDEEFQITVFRGIRNRAKELGLELICVQGETVQNRTTRGDKPFSLSRAVHFDGILLLTPVILDNTTSCASPNFTRILPSQPSISVGLSIPGMVSVSIKNRRSMARIMEHLVLDHGYRRFLFIGGPRGHRDSRAREQIFRQTLRAFKVSHPSLEWTIEYGGFTEIAAMEIIRKHLREKPFDAVVAANDNMARGVIKELKLHDNPAWHSCAVTGFDDIPQAAIELPTLTTVHQPLQELGERAVDRLIALIEKRDEALNSAIASWPVIRESCGCSTFKGSDFLSPKAVEVTELEDKLAFVTRQALESEQWLRQEGYLGRDLSAVTDLDSLLSLLDIFLTNLAVPCFFMVIFEEVQVQHGGLRGRLVYERLDGRKSRLPDRGMELDLEQLLSQRLPGPDWQLCLAHLRAGEEQLGLVLYSADDRTLSNMASAMPHVANALKRLRVLATQEDRNRKLELMVADRTRDLQEANKQLTQEIERRKMTEGEVLQVSEFERRRFGLDLHDDICQRLAGLTMYLKSSRPKTLPDAGILIDEVAGILDETLYLTRQYAHQSFPIDLDRRGLDTIMQNLCASVAAQSGCGCRYESELDLLDPPFSGPEALNVYRIVQEALHNAVKHARASEIVVSVKVSRSFCEVKVSDNGRGIQKESQTEDGLGLRSMAYRARQLNALFSIESSGGVGTSILLEIPRSLNYPNR